MDWLILLNGLPVWKHCFGDWLEWWYRQLFLFIPAGIITVAAFWSGSESGVVVLCGGAPCRLADSGCYVLFGRIAAFPFTHTDGRCVGNGRFRTIAVDRHEPFQLLAAYAETRTDRCEHASGRDHATARIPCRDLVVACLFVFLIWALVWMFQALKVSCNLKGYRLGILYCVGIFGGDVLCRYLIKWACYWWNSRLRSPAISSTI